MSEFNISIPGGQSKRLKTGGKYCPADILVTAEGGGEIDIYKGSYDVTPSVNSQTLETKDKLLTDNVRIKAIPYFDVGNTAGGSTVYIGSLEEITGDNEN